MSVANKEQETDSEDDKSSTESEESNDVFEEDLVSTIDQVHNYLCCICMYNGYVIGFVCL